MIRIVLLLCCLFFSFAIFAEDAVISLETAPINTHDYSSIKRGAHFFATNCMSCHTLIYLRYDDLAKEAGITLEKMPIKVTQWPFGIKPPDLSLEANYRGVNWIYTYLHSFYKDTSRPTGFNNLLVPNTMMPGVIAPYQGTQIRIIDVDKSKGKFNSNLQWYDVLVIEHQGSMTQIQFDTTVADVVNFLHYAANPYEKAQRQIGLWVIVFLIIMFILMYWLKHEYWKEVQHKKD